MTDLELARAVLGISVETGSLVCLGCGHEQNCGIHGCAVLRQAAERLTAPTKERAVTWPKELWAIKPNPRSREWNDEPENHIVHYIVHAYEPGTGRYFVNVDSLPGLKRRHWIHGKGLYKSRAKADEVLKKEKNCE